MFETDEDDFTFSPSSKLSSIFAGSTASDDSNPKLTYKAPKQPKALSQTNSSEQINPDSQIQPQSSVLLAKVVTLWKVENSKNIAMGKYMVALIGNATKDLFEMIIYQDKTNIFIREPLTKWLVFYEYPSHFLAFHDSQKQVWNLNFDSAESTESFKNCILKYNCKIVKQTVKDTARQKVDEEPKARNKSKEKILSRITKLGQQILPAKPQNSELSDSESESSCGSNQKPTIAPRRFKKSTLNNNENKALTPIIKSENSSVFIPNNQMMLNGMLYSQPIPDYNITNLIVAQNAELKANLAEINARLSNMNMSSIKDANGNNSEELSSLHRKIKCQNLKIDNLTAELEREKRASDDLRGKYKDIIESEKLIIARADNSQELAKLQNEIEQLKIELVEKDGKALNLEEKLKENSEREESEKQTLLKEIDDLKQQLQETSLKLKAYEDESHNSKTSELDKEKVVTTVKECMSEAYKRIIENLCDNQNYSAEEIEFILLDNLKKSSYSLINSLLK